MEVVILEVVIQGEALSEIPSGGSDTPVLRALKGEVLSEVYPVEVRLMYIEPHQHRLSAI